MTLTEPAALTLTGERTLPGIRAELIDFGRGGLTTGASGNERLSQLASLLGEPIDRPRCVT